MQSDGGQNSEPTGYGPNPPAGTAPVPASASAPAPAPAPAPDGRLLGGRYRLAARLGHGGMGTVWRAHDEVVDRDVAVKEPRLPATVDDRRRAMLHERMRREARAAARIGHPNVVTVHDVVIEDGQPWLVMELVRGESLADVLESGTLEPREAARVGLAVLGALHAAHEAGVLHRDVKPGNVLLGRHDRVVLTDFGIAQVEGEQGLTDTGAFVGSPEFTAPERASGRRPGPESDLWSLGVLLYAAVEGVSPFRRSNHAATVQAVLTADPAPPARAAGPLGDLVMRLLDKRPAARPKADAIRRALTRIAEAPPAPADATLAATRLAGQQSASGTSTLSLRNAGDGGNAGDSDENGNGGRPRRRWPLLAAAAAATAAVLALPLLLVPASPLSLTGDDAEASALPDGWRRHEEERVRISLAAPSAFERSVTESEDPESDQQHVAFASRDGIYTINAWTWTDTEDRRPLQAAADWFDGWRENTDYADVTGDFRESRFQERDAAETWVQSRPAYVYDEEEDRVTRRQVLFYGDPDGGEAGGARLWQVQVDMPGERGPARAYGEELYADVLAHLEIHDTGTDTDTDTDTA